MGRVRQVVGPSLPERGIWVALPGILFFLENETSVCAFWRVQKYEN